MGRAIMARYNQLSQRVADITRERPYLQTQRALRGGPSPAPRQTLLQWPNRDRPPAERVGPRGISDGRRSVRRKRDPTVLGRTVGIRLQPSRQQGDRSGDRGMVELEAGRAV